METIENNVAGIILVQVQLYELVHIVWSLSLIGQSMEKKYCLVSGKVLFPPQEPGIAKKVLSLPLIFFLAWIQSQTIITSYIGSD